MQCVVRYSFLLIICSISWADSSQVLIRATGQDIIIECATDIIPQDGVYMYKQGAASERQEIFYCYKPDIVTHKTMSKSKVSVSGALPNLNVTLLHVTAEDNGLYWCEFVLEEKTTLGKFTWLWIENSEEEKKEFLEEEKKECPEEVLPHAKHLLILFAVISLLCIIVFFCVILKVKGCWGNRQYTRSDPPSDL